MELSQFKGQSKNELAMVDVAHAILETTGEVSDFNDLLAEVADYLELDDKENLNVGHGMCSGAFIYEPTHKYKVRFSIMDMCGSFGSMRPSPAWARSGRRTSPSDAGTTYP